MKKFVKYHFDNKRSVIENADISEIDNVDSYLSSFLDTYVETNGLSAYDVQQDFGDASGASTEIEQQITLPKAGLYSLDCFFLVEETTSGSPVYTQNPQQLYAKSGGGTYKVIDMSGYYAFGPGSNSFWFNKSLQGSCLIRVSAGDLTIHTKIYLPNGTLKRRIAGYMHAVFISN